MFDKRSHSRNAARRRAIVQAACPALEALEGRVLLSTAYTVNSLSDQVAADGVVTLREALQAANTDAAVYDAPAGAGADVITFDPGLFASGAQMIALTDGHLPVADEVTILGPGSGLLTLDGLHARRILHVGDDATVQGLRLINGESGKAGDFSSHGGGIYINPGVNVVLRNLVIDDCRENLDTGLGWDYGDGGGIYNAGNLSIYDSSILNCVAGNNRNGEAHGGGALYNAAGATLLMSNCDISNNWAKTSGNGILNAYLATAVIEDSRFSYNYKDQYQGIRGGAFYNAGNLTIVRSLIYSNASLEYTSGNGRGGGIYNASDGQAKIYNSTFYGNAANINGGDNIDSDGQLLLVNCTVVAGSHGNIAVTGPARLMNTVVWGGGSYADIYGAIDPTSANNLVGAPEVETGLVNGVLGNQVGTLAAPLDPLVALLASNGGGSPTMLPLPNSPLLDAGSTAVALGPDGLPLTTDARGPGYARVVGVTVDIGAVELGGAGAIGDLVWNDADNDGVRDAGEVGIDGVVVRLYASDGDAAFEPGAGDALIASRATQAGGAFQFSAVSPGQYWVQVDESSTPLQQFTRTTAANPVRLDLALDEQRLDLDFGYRPSLVVSLAADESDGYYSAGDLSLREALLLARGLPGANVIEFAPALGGASVTLLPTLGQLLIDSDVSVIGPAGGFAISASGGSRVVALAPGVTVSLSDLTLINGQSSEGGAAYVGAGASLSLTRCNIGGSTATLRGGGVYVAYGASLSLVDSHVHDNTAGDQGGGVYSEGTLSMTGTTLSGNQASSSAAGRGRGGAIYTRGDLAASNSTMASNSASHRGGALYAEYGDIALLNLTIANNRSGVVNPAGADGGGIYNDSASLRIDNSVIAHNRQGPLGTADDIFGAVDAGSSFNFIGVDSGLLGVVHGAGGNRIGTVVAPLDASLYALGDYGGATPTMPPREGSPLLDAGDNAAAAALALDQRGVARALAFAGPTPRIDIGAVELGPLIRVNSLLDEATDTDSLLSLREAIALAGTRPGLDLIRFDAALAIGDQIMVPVSLGELLIDSQVELQGLSNIKVSLDAGGGSRVLRVGAAGHALLSSLAITHGAASTGAGIRNEGTLELRNVLLTANVSTGDGGGLWSSGTLLALNTTLSGNSAAGSGGGVFVAGASAVLTNVTIAINAASVAGNGGGIAVGSGDVVLRNAIVAQNTSGGGTVHSDPFGSFSASSSHNFIGAIDGSVGLTGAGTQYGSVAAPADPRLTALLDNGGPTLTHAVLPASPVVDSGSDTIAVAAGLLLDARGLPRYRDGDDDGSARVDKGAFEQQMPLNRSPDLSAIASLPGGVEGRPLSVRFDQLLAASDAIDPDGNPLSFRIESVQGGTLILNGQPVIAGQTMFSAGQTLVWIPPTIDFGALKTVTVSAFSVTAHDGQVSSGAPVPVSVEVTTTAEPVNYAVLFSGGDRIDLNYALYYQNLKRVYQVLTTQYGMRPADISVVYADGRDPAADQKGGINSDMSFAANVVPATRANLRQTLVELSRKVDANDHLFVWTFDHGLGTPAQPGATGEEVIKGWGAGEVIHDHELAVWLQGLQAGQSPSTYGVEPGYAGIDAGYATYVFGQCFAGGMLDNLQAGPSKFGAAASNHYEASYADYFIGAFTDALERGYNTTASAFAYAFDKDGRARAPGAANAGDWTFNAEHPWSAGGDFAIFATSRQLNANPEIRSATPLKMPAAGTELTITYDLLMAALDVVDPSGQSPAFRITAVDLGQVWRDGTIVDVAGGIERATLTYDRPSLVWKRPPETSGVLSALRVRAVSADGSLSNEVVLPIRIGDPDHGATARTDSQALQGSTTGVLISPLNNDTGSGLRVIRVGQPLHGSLSLDPITAQVRYTPAAEYLGADLFSYVVQDSQGRTDIATVNLSIVAHDPSLSGSQQYLYRVTELSPPPGWAELPTTWDWSYRQSLPDWETTRAVDINDEGMVLVRTSRPNQPDGSLNYVGSTNASYRWLAGSGEPYWNADATGAVVASNALLLLLQAYHPTTGLPMYSPQGREIFDGIEAFSVRNPDVTPHLRYLDPDNASEAGFPSVGGLWFDVDSQAISGDQDFWQLTEYLIPVDVSGTPTNSPSYLLAGNSPDSAQLWLVDTGNQTHTLLATIAGVGISEAKAVSDTGIMAGLLGVASGQFHAFTYQHGGYGLRTLVPTGSFTDSAALAINDWGVAVGYSASHGRDEPSPLTPGIATLWDSNGDAISLGALNGAGWSVAYDISDNGTIVGASNGKAVMWIGGIIHDLNELLPQYLTAGLLLTEARGINAAGQIVANGTLNGETRAYFLDLASGIDARDDEYETSSRRPITFNVLANDVGTGLTIQSVDSTGMLGSLTWHADGQFTFDPAGAFNDLQPNQTRSTSFTYTAGDQLGGVDTATVTITVKALNTFHVTSFAATGTGVLISFSHALELAQLDLYDGSDATVDMADLTLTGQSTGAVRGSIVIHDNTTLEFIATGGPLAGDTYTLALHSAGDGFSSSTLGALDGDANDAPGGDFSQSFSIATPQRSLLIGDIARGPGQSFGTPSNPGGGLPIVLSDAAGLLAAHLVLRYDPNLLSVTSVRSAIADWTVTPNLSTPGIVDVAIFGTSALPAGPRTVLYLDAVVPETAPYGAAQVLYFEQMNLSDGLVENNISAVADRAMHKVLFPGDANGNGAYTAMDAALIARVSVDLDSGFDAARLIDPRIVADVTGDGTLSPVDASAIARASIFIPIDSLPELPAGFPSTFFTGPDPVIAAPQMTLLPGESTTRALSIDQAAGLLSLNLSLAFDVRQLSLSSDDISAGEVLAGWGIFGNLVGNRLHVAAYGVEPLAPGGGSLLSLTAYAKASAVAGASVLDLGGQLNDGALALTAADGILYVPLPGDLSLDGVIDADDYFAIDAGFLTQGSPGAADRALAWSRGDINFDGRIDIDDYFAIDCAFASQAGILSQWPPTPIPAAAPRFGPHQAAAPESGLFGDVRVSDEGVLDFDDVFVGAP